MSQCTRLTDRQTDGRTDGRTDRILIVRPRLHSMQRGKNLNIAFFRFVTMHAFDRRTDGQTDRQTEFPSLYRDCIPCSSVKSAPDWTTICEITNNQFGRTHILGSGRLRSFRFASHNFLMSYMTQICNTSSCHQVSDCRLGLFIPVFTGRKKRYNRSKVA